MQLGVQRKLADKPFLEIDVGRLHLGDARIRLLEEVGPDDSGVIVGPKAAELGRLRKLFPERVSNAAVIPFGASSSAYWSAGSPSGSSAWI